MKAIKPLIGISVGDPAGIGPEITAKALALPEIYEMCRPLVVAESQMMRASIRYKTVSVETGRASFEYVKKVIDLALAGEIEKVPTQESQGGAT